MKKNSEKSLMLKCAHCGGGAVTISEGRMSHTWRISPGPATS